VDNVSITYIVIHILLARWLSLVPRCVAVEGRGRNKVGQPLTRKTSERYWPRHRCEDCFKMYVQEIPCKGLDCIHVGLARVRW
jgi:hypothetical protein